MPYLKGAQIMALIHYQKGDIFDSNTQVIVNTVNCKGIMGKGLALAFKQRYPAMFPVYQQECKTGKLRIGRPSLYKASNPWILNFPTKDHWRTPSKIEYLEKGLEYFVKNYKKAGIQSIAFPKLGAQNGKLSWDEVGPLMARYLNRIDIDVYIYIAEGDKEYQYNEQSENNLKVKIWKEFSELALSLERLNNEVQLSIRGAKQVAEARAAREFTSLADIESIERLANDSLKKIKKYIAGQQCQQAELIELQSTGTPASQRTKKQRGAPQGTKKGRKKVETSDNVSLFPVGLVG
jgi:O-acetyl-ADP-ribose deacetylase (regulator of RNase III)